MEEILAVRRHYRKLQYRVKWLGHDNDDTWYPAGNFKTAPVKLMMFHNQYPRRPGPPARLKQWLEAAEDDIFLEDHEDDNKEEAT